MFMAASHAAHLQASSGSAGQVGAEGWDFRRGAETVPVCSVDGYFTGTFPEGKSLTCHLPTVNNFWKDIWLNRIERLASEIERNYFTFLSSAGCLCHCFSL